MESWPTKKWGIRESRLRPLSGLGPNLSKVGEPKSTNVTEDEKAG